MLPFAIQLVSFDEDDWSELAITIPLNNSLLEWLSLPETELYLQMTLDELKGKDRFQKLDIAIDKIGLDSLEWMRRR